MKSVTLLFTRCVVLCIGLSFSVEASVSLIRDSEAEILLSESIRPLLTAAGVEGDIAKIHIINSPVFNAFVTGGYDLYVNSGLLINAGSLEVVLGVLAHEIAHVSLGHVARKGMDIDDALKSMVIVNAAGLLLTLAGQGSTTDIGAAMLFAGRHVTQRKLLSYSRIQEMAADINAVDYMREALYDPSGLADAMMTVDRKYNVYVEEKDINIYLLTHPEARHRVDYIRDYILKSDPLDIGYKDLSELNKAYNRIVVKFDAFTGKESEIMKKYAGDDCINRYGRAILAYREGHKNQSLHDMLDLCNECYANDPYIYELIAQIYYDLGEYESSIQYYRMSLRELDYDDIVIKTEMISALIAAGEDYYLIEAENKINSMLLNNYDSPDLWYRFAMLYSKRNDDLNSYLCLAEHSLLIYDYGAADKYIRMVVGMDEYQDNASARQKISRMKKLIASRS